MPVHTSNECVNGNYVNMYIKWKTPARVFHPFSLQSDCPSSDTFTVVSAYVAGSFMPYVFSRIRWLFPNRVTEKQTVPTPVHRSQGIINYEQNLHKS